MSHCTVPTIVNHKVGRYCQWETGRQKAASKLPRTKVMQKKTPEVLLKCSFSFNLRDRYVLGGIHLTNLAFLPNALLKEITATEYKRSITSFYNNHFALADLEEQQVVKFLLKSIKKYHQRWG